jgi:hypothetical protein
VVEHLYVYHLQPVELHFVNIWKELLTQPTSGKLGSLEVTSKKQSTAYSDGYTVVASVTSIILVER